MSNGVDRYGVSTVAQVTSGSVAVRRIVPGRVNGLVMGGIVLRPEVPGPVETIVINWSILDRDGNQYPLYDGAGNLVSTQVDDNQAVPVPPSCFLFEDFQATLEDVSPETYTIYACGKG